MNLLDIIIEEFYDSNKIVESSDLPDGFGIPTTPVVSYFCFNSPLDTVYYKDDTLKESLLEDRPVEKSAMKKARKEKRVASKGKTSEETGTVYKLTKEQKRALRFIRKKYGKEIVKEVKEFRKNFLAPYQVIKSNLEKSKSLYPKEVLGMSKEEYLRAKRRAENKIENMRSNRYSDLSREFSDLSSKGEAIDALKVSLKDSSGNLNSFALRRVFDKYNLNSKRFTDSDFEALENKIKDRDVFIKNLLDKVSAGDIISKEEISKMEEKEKSVGSSKSEMVSGYKDRRTKENVKEVLGLENLESATKKINDLESSVKDLDISDSEKREALDRIKKYISIKGEKITSKTFSDEYDLYLIRKGIKEKIEKGNKDKYFDEYVYQVRKSKERNIGRRGELLDAMTKERLNKNLTDLEKKIYQLKRDAPRDSDKIEDYILKIKEEDFFEPIFFSKSEEMKDAEKKIDAEIKRFERGLQSKMEEKDFRLLKKYRLINNLLTVKDLKSVKSLFSRSK